ncbi:hypothetical protein FSP39_002950 [Pinctada imbricata]|uniref:Uncharacterized protein n=1 Tax=Pinctada imbricata TaxID=66713 RepID=A0AA88Y1X1_PINIB|nr:hypothetical protein FSP39_002950 [Pinctada imbricata]
MSHVGSDVSVRGSKEQEETGVPGEKPPTEAWMGDHLPSHIRPFAESRIRTRDLRVLFSSVIFCAYGQSLDVNSITRGLSTEEKRQMLASLRMTLSRIRAARKNLNTQPSQNSNGVNDARANLINPARVQTTARTVNSGTRTVNSGTRTVNSGTRTVNSGTRTINSGTRTVNSGTRTVNSGAKQAAANPLARTIQRAPSSVIQRQQSTGFPSQRAAPQNVIQSQQNVIQAQQNIQRGQQISPRDSAQRPVIQQRQPISDNRRVNTMNLKQSAQRNVLSRNSMSRSQQTIQNPQMNRNMIPPNNNLPPVPGRNMNNRFSQMRNGRVGNPLISQSVALRGGNRMNVQGQGQLNSARGNNFPMNRGGQGQIQPRNTLPSNGNMQVQNMSRNKNIPNKPNNGRPTLQGQGHQQSGMGQGHQQGSLSQGHQTSNTAHNSQRVHTKVTKPAFRQPPTGAPKKGDANGKSIGISVQVKRKTEVKKIPHNGATPTHPSSTQGGRPSSVPSHMTPTHPSPGSSPHSTVRGSSPHHSTAGHGPLPTSPSRMTTGGRNGGFKRTPPIPRPTPPVVLLPRFIQWQTLYPSGEMGMETAEALPSQRLILITSDQVPMYDEYQSSTTLMDFSRGMVAIRVEMPSGAFMPPTKVCFTMKNPGNFNQTKKELLRRSNSKMAMELGEVIHVIAAASNVQNGPTLQRTAGPFISKFCEEALFTNNVYKLVPEAPVEPGPQTITVSGLVSPIDPGRSLPVSIAVDTAINFFGPNKVPTTPPP